MNSWFPLQQVSQAARDSWLVDSREFIRLGESFTIIMVDDEGPFKLIDPEFQDVQCNNRRYHVVLFNGKLVWIWQDWMESCELVG